MNKSQLIEEIREQIKIAEEHNCTDRDCHANRLGNLAVLRAVYRVLLMPENTRRTFRGIFLYESKKGFDEFLEMYPDERTVFDVIDKQLRKLYSPSTLTLNLLGYRYEGLVLLKGNIRMEALTRNSLELIIDGKIFEEMIQIYAKSNVIGMAVVIFREYEQGHKVVQQYINYKLEPNVYEDLKSQLQAKYDL